MLSRTATLLRASPGAARSFSTSSTVDYQALIMGAPGSGKGTISKRMVKKFGMEVNYLLFLLLSGPRAKVATKRAGFGCSRTYQQVISTGDLIRDQIRAETDMGTSKSLPV